MSIILSYLDETSEITNYNHKTLMYLYQFASKFSKLPINLISLVFQGKIIPYSASLVGEYFSSYNNTLMITIEHKRLYNDNVVLICRECKNSKNLKLFYCRQCNSVICYDCSLTKKHKEHKMFSLQNKTYEECVLGYQLELLSDIEKNEKKKVLINSLNEIIEKINNSKLKLEIFSKDINSKVIIDFDSVKKDINDINSSIINKENSNNSKEYIKQSIIDDMNKLNKIDNKIIKHCEINEAYDDLFVNINRKCDEIKKTLNEINEIINQKLEPNNNNRSSLLKLKIKTAISTEKNLFLPKIRNSTIKIPKFNTISHENEVHNSGSISNRNKKVSFSIIETNNNTTSLNNSEKVKKKVKKIKSKKLKLVIQKS